MLVLKNELFVKKIIGNNTFFSKYLVISKKSSTFALAFVRKARVPLNNETLNGRLAQLV